ncbi:response regulator transcription factor [Micromonospora tarensis]|uniref:Response regulator transcription factor n=1 Tax=Micromonospora tarensis TaxID=2806100 RepID=A0ABS1YAD0_9ACTN|nr:LuxR C-terminal-related transcriptional regulator [Micromonospora tarensis]MBM0274320.1 response regulator transcription factor [Micromonospora tarensis]
MHVAVLEPLEVLRCGLETMLRRLEKVNSLECRRTIEELVVAIKASDSEWAPDIVILSCCSSDDITDEVRAEFPSGRILELVARADSEHLEMATRTPVDGYLMMRDITETTLDSTLQALMRGELPMPLPVANYLLQRARSSDVAPLRRQPYFSPRENDVVTLLLEGLSNRQIADRLRISLHSAKRQVSTVLNKVNSPSRAHFVAHMLREE